MLLIGRLDSFACEMMAASLAKDAKDKWSDWVHVSQRSQPGFQIGGEQSFMVIVILTKTQLRAWAARCSFRRRHAACGRAK